jgi:Zn-dependent M28 family amino/carboxypeptidase
MVLAVADAFTRLPEPPARSVLFMTLTAEESGLLGARYYVENPVVPMPLTIANINLDSGNLFGRTRDIVGIGSERSDLIALLRQAAEQEGMTVSPDVQPNQGLFFRSDQLHFARSGVPAVFLNTGRDFIGRSDDYGERVTDEYRNQRYHQPTDSLSATTPLGGLIQQTRVALRLGYRLAESDIRPQWNPNEDFGEARRLSEEEAEL